MEDVADLADGVAQLLGFGVDGEVDEVVLDGGEVVGLQVAAGVGEDADVVEGDLAGVGDVGQQRHLGQGL